MRIARGTLLAALVVAVGATLPVRGADEAGPVDAKAAFDRLKGLVGTWEGEAHGQAMTVVFRLTGAGSALVETQFPGTDHEMVSVYHLDGDDLRMTHYCAAGNQPRVKLAREKSKVDDLMFDFDGGTNLDPAKDIHIHDVRITLKDADHVESKWVAYVNGKPSEHAESFVLTRKK
jgi:hypothetical protein